MKLSNQITTVDYQVMAGAYTVAVRMVNLPEKAINHDASQIGRGSFGSVVLLSDDNDEFVAKRVMFDG